DLAEAAVAVLSDPASHAGAIYELAGAEAFTVADLARELGATWTIEAGTETDVVSEVRQLTGGGGAAVVLDFVGEGLTPAQGLAMTRRGGAYFVIGYGGRLEVPTVELVSQEKAIIGNLVGTYAELVELMELVGEGRIKVAVTYYPLAQVNQALRDLRDGRVKGRAVVVP
ncbi:MAG: zinc-binding dehydrogenase, partial [Thermomicrobium sp.]